MNPIYITSLTGEDLQYMHDALFTLFCFIIVAWVFTYDTASCIDHVQFQIIYMTISYVTKLICRTFLVD
ncbi:hypothetical protein Scep_011577 [Stephania cephalantha]|uniref:Uncharacterized protein n=1 Tax=Stephania cephalantha TaxID=152367 RepID=A0AAP0JDM3_9MAGN